MITNYDWLLCLIPHIHVGSDPGLLSHRYQASHAYSGHTLSHTGLISFLYLMTGDGDIETSLNMILITSASQKTFNVQS